MATINNIKPMNPAVSDPCTRRRSSSSSDVMWRSRARALLLHSLHSHLQIQPPHQIPLKTLTLTQPSRPLPSRLIPNLRLFSSANDAANPSLASASNSNEFGISDTVDSTETPAWNFDEPDGSPMKLDDADEDVDSSKTSAWNFEEPAVEADKGDAFGEITEESGDSSPRLEVEGDGDGAVVKVAEIGAEQVESVVSVLKGAAEEAIELSLDRRELSLSEEFVVKVIEASDGVGENLIRFFKWAFENEESVKSSRAIELLIRSVKRVPEFSNNGAYMLWDLVKELGKAKWVLNTEILNEFDIHVLGIGEGEGRFRSI